MDYFIKLTLLAADGRGRGYGYGYPIIVKTRTVLEIILIYYKSLPSETTSRHTLVYVKNPTTLDFHHYLDAEDRLTLL